jgi:hypothetical protein
MYLVLGDGVTNQSYHRCSRVGSIKYSNHIRFIQATITKIHSPIFPTHILRGFVLIKALTCKPQAPRPRLQIWFSLFHELYNCQKLNIKLNNVSIFKNITWHEKHRHTWRCGGSWRGRGGRRIFPQGMNNFYFQTENHTSSPQPVFHSTQIDLQNNKNALMESICEWLN